MTKSLRAAIRYRDNEYGAFEVMSVLGHLRRTFPRIIICVEDRAWRDFDWFEERFESTDGAEYGGAMKTALRDGIRRGPRFPFRFPASSGEIIFGWAGRDSVGFFSEDDFSPELEQALRTFLESLHLGQPEIRE